MTIHIPVPPSVAAAHEHRLAHLAHLRTLIADEINAGLDRVHRYIAVLDALEPDPDLEADYQVFRAIQAGNGVVGVSSDFEPSLCAAEWLDGIAAHVPSDNSLHFLDREHDEADDELILGSPEVAGIMKACSWRPEFPDRSTTQVGWARGSTDDRELDGEAA
ncbi:hypothetical protein MKK84_14480 [Methylobacterium sp. E-065]|uniref:hypothetical protein n=1 Tax=Methylobacterium sp. E-065 TaxID=2836583 RepID=UPI001FB9D7E2|nr:hypothetical protein [Methylobacterium sp. E-065]MCJ2018629.1 hypothetical protein [Methylobacterium sp. E-065]